MAYQLLKRLSLIGAVLALCVVVLGAYVRLSDAGLGCPDWPGCFGTLTVPESESAIQQAQIAFPDKPVETGKAWKEMAHRYLAGALGFVVLAIFVFTWKERRIVKMSPHLTTGLLGLIIFQALLGMWTVTLLLKPVIVSAHLIGGMTTLGILTWIAHRCYGQFNVISISPSLKLAIRLAVLVLLGQIFLGGWTSTNYAALACTDFPTCHGVWMPDMNFKDAFHLVRELGQSADGGQLTLASLTAIQWTHRIGALIVFLYVGALGLKLIKIPEMKILSILLVTVMLTQIVVGIGNLVMHLPLLLAVAHNLGAALLVVIIVVINSKITPKTYRQSK
ncbi:MAG TPA: COX15/CtaA family protein [Methylotenera sp.]|nr:COX15/CtaA family protein [Methylotenera sp.]HPH05354.1 COX15/CtaA family protein [Methylotenera sp.]HPN01280.1 COX15/CtaA family protein [Methylotenera sp.]